MSVPSIDRKVSGHIFVCYGYRCWLFLRLWYLILELFRPCGILELFRPCGILELFRPCGIFGIVPTVWYFGIVPTVWYFGIVQTVWYFVVFILVLTQLRERPFNLKGGLWFFSKKIFWFWWREKKNLIQSFCHIT